jgi:hypothetical protein
MEIKTAIISMIYGRLRITVKHPLIILFSTVFNYLLTLLIVDAKTLSYEHKS